MITENVTEEGHFSNPSKTVTCSNVGDAYYGETVSYYNFPG